MSAPELKPCPFCGPMNGHYGFTIGRFWTRLTCFCCDSHGPRAETREEAISSWNTRSALPISAALDLPEIKALVEAAEYILDGMGIDAPLYEIDPDDDFLDAANSEWVSDTLRRLATALRAIGEGGE